MRPASSIALSTPYTAPNPPGIPSVAIVSLVTIPYRVSSWLATAAAHVVAVGGSPAHDSTSDQRPSAEGGTFRRLRKARRASALVRLGGGSVYALSACRASLVTTPLHTSSQIARTVSSG